MVKIGERWLYQHPLFYDAVVGEEIYNIVDEGYLVCAEIAALEKR